MNSLHKATFAATTDSNEFLKAAVTKFTPLYEDISGTIGAFTMIDPTYQDDEVNRLIDPLLMLDPARFDDELESKVEQTENIEF